MTGTHGWRLVPHPAHPAATVSSVEARVTASGGELRLAFTVHGAGALLVPPPRAPARADALWQTTCFELFLREPAAAAYREFNFSPSGQWAAYRFSGYRAGMEEAALPADPRVAGRREADAYVLEAQLSLAPPLPALPMSLSAVIEEAGGVRSFWALAHGSDRPDFHDPACFVAELPAASAP